MRFSEPMKDLIYIRVACDEKARLVEAARNRGQSLSDLLRLAVTEATQRVAA